MLIFIGSVNLSSGGVHWQSAGCWHWR